VVTCGAGMVIASRPSAARRRALQAQHGAVGVRLDKPQFASVVLDQGRGRLKPPARYRDLGNRVDAARAHHVLAKAEPRHPLI